MRVTDRAGLAALVTIVWGSILSIGISKYPYPHVFNHDVDSPVIALEISRGEKDIDMVLHRKDLAKNGLAKEIREKAKKCMAKAKESMALANDLDLIFIPLYAIAIWSLARVFTCRTRLLTSGLAAAALFDYLEDWQIYRALDGASPPIYIVSLIKWAFLGLLFVALGRILAKSSSPIYTLPTKRLMAVGFVVSGGLIVMDVALGQWIGYSHIALGVEIFSLLLIANVVGFLGPYLKVAGIDQVFVENFCEERKKPGDSSMTAVKGEPAK